jgi:hypothetical protein
MTGLLKTFIYRQTSRRKTDHYATEPDEKRKEAIDSAKAARAEVKTRIENMIAQLDTCGDRWFLAPKQTLDECFSEEEMESEKRGGKSDD